MVNRGTDTSSPLLNAVRYASPLRFCNAANWGFTPSTEVDQVIPLLTVRRPAFTHYGHYRVCVVSRRHRL